MQQTYNYLDKEKDYIGAMKAVDEMAFKAGVKPEIIALKIVGENIPTLNRYVIESGEIPEKQPIALAAQVTLLHENKIWDKLEHDGVGSYEAAEREVLAEEQAAEDNGEISSFVGSLLGVVFKAGNKALPKINEKRKANGKTELLAGEKGRKLREKVLKHVEIEDRADRAKGAAPASKFSKTGTGIYIDEVMAEVERQKTEEAIKGYLPFIIIGVIAIFLIGKNFK